jgi:hypothetical protein
VTPPGHWDEIAEHAALEQHLNLQQNARLFALVNIGLADAAINCWDAKYIYNYWRPITAIRDPRADLINPANTSDPNWAPLWNTPNFPSYTSGHSTFSGAASTILASIFGPGFAFTNGSDDMPGYGRSFTSFAQAADEAGESRVVGGIHFSFDNTVGLTAGRQIGNYIASHFLLPVSQSDDTGGDSASRFSAVGLGSKVVVSPSFTQLLEAMASLTTPVRPQPTAAPNTVHDPGLSAPAAINAVHQNPMILPGRAGKAAQHVRPAWSLADSEGSVLTAGLADEAGSVA